MSKKMNTVLFIIGATAFNLLVIVVLMFLSLLLIGVLVRGRASQGLVSALMMVFFLGSIAGAFFIYSWVMKKITQKIDMEKYFLPLFRRRRR